MVKEKIVFTEMMASTDFTVETLHMESLTRQGHGRKRDLRENEVFLRHSKISSIFKSRI